MRIIALGALLLVGASCVFGCADSGSAGKQRDAGRVARDSGSTDYGADAGYDDAGTTVGSDGSQASGKSDAGNSRVLPDGGHAICTSCGACDQAVQVGPALHVEGPIAYSDPPPAGGSHNPCWSTWGVHAQAVLPEHWVHNLEHGGVVFLYDCPSGCASEIKQLEKLVTGRDRALLTAYPDLPGKARFATVSWGHRLVSSCFDEAAFLAFYKAHVDHGPESISSDPPSDCPP